MATFEQEYARIVAECEAVRAQIEHNRICMQNDMVQQQVNHINEQLMINQQMINQQMVNQQMELAHQLHHQLHMEHLHTIGM